LSTSLELIQKNPHWKDLITHQLNDLVSTQLSSFASSISIVLSSENNSSYFDDTGEALLSEATFLVRSILPETKTSIFLHTGNHFEYPGIRRVWDIAFDNNSSNHIILYFHGKGMFNPRTNEIRNPLNEILTNSVIRRWKEIIHRFCSDPLVQKAGYASAPWGWMWFNFWWVRASYAQQLVRPSLSEYRWLYEDWLGKLSKEGTEDGWGNWKVSGCKGCLSMCKGNHYRVLNYVMDARLIGC